MEVPCSLWQRIVHIVQTHLVDALLETLLENMGFPGRKIQNHLSEKAIRPREPTSINTISSNAQLRLIDTCRLETTGK